MEYTTPGINGLEKAFSADTTKTALNNVKSTSAELAAATAATPLDLAEKALKKLSEIKEDDIEHDDSLFLEKIDQIESRVKRLRSYVQDV